MDQNYGSLGAADNMYEGNMVQWYKFANSLKLRMGMLLSDVDPALAKTTDHETRAHLEASKDEIAKILDPKFAPPTPAAGAAAMGGRGGIRR